MRSRSELAGSSFIGLGVFCLVAAAMLPTYAAHRIAKTPLNLDITIVATTAAAGNSGAEVLDMASLRGDGPLRVLRDVPLISQQHALVVDPSDATVLTIQAASTVRRGDIEGDTALLTATVDTVTIDRRTGQPAAGGTGAIQSRAGVPAEVVPHTGLQYRFPLGTKKISYPYFDTISRTSTPIDYIDETTIDGVWVLHFRQRVAPVDLAASTPPTSPAMTLPARKWGIADADEPITMHEWYTCESDLWVEPATGAIVQGRQSPRIYFARQADEPGISVMKATLALTADSVAQQLHEARKGITLLEVGFRVVPIVLLVTAVASAAAGAFLLRRSRIRAFASGPAAKN
ncbi:MAG: rane protein [Nocardia sp.]|uniref:DUF3068 domain-containing protein n=1 Tax=Nocardia sp. TaxID=1821 RepID=UPI00262120B9|nr:DUF3068 domain-containing protein [Nocardia sp.]MCU1648050.1 rane protein [Nocardia sp.]